MANCLTHASLADDDLSKLCMVLEIVLANNQCGILLYLQIVPYNNIMLQISWYRLALVYYRADTGKAIWTQTDSIGKH